MTILIIADFVLLGLWALWLDPAPSLGIGIIVIIPAVIVVCLILAIVIPLVVKRFIWPLWVNIAIAPIIMLHLYSWATDRNTARYADTWEFHTQDTLFMIDVPRHGEYEGTYDMTFSTTPWMSEGHPDYRGTVERRGDTIFFTSVCDHKFYIHNRYIHGFRNDSLKVRKRY